MNEENGKMPVHVAVIPDGNRRWAKERGLEPVFGHRKSAEYEHIKSLVNEAKRCGVRHISFWVFSTENWKRSRSEIDELFKIAFDFISKYRKEAKKENIRFRHLGRKDRIPKKLADEIAKLEEESRSNTGINVQILLDYGGRDEIARAVNKMIKDGRKEVKEEDFASYLDSCGIPEPDLIIRTSGEMRTSGLFMFQSAYSELYFSKKYFPDFSAADLRKAIREFAKRGRRFGGN
jgi:undecaprenyl diphosphate synthase